MQKNTGKSLNSKRPNKFDKKFNKKANNDEDEFGAGPQKKIKHQDGETKKKFNRNISYFYLLTFSRKRLLSKRK